MLLCGSVYVQETLPYHIGVRQPIFNALGPPSAGTSRQARQDTTKPVQHNLLLRRARIALRARLSNTNTNIAPTRTHHLTLSRQAPTVTASHNILAREDRNGSVDPGQHKLEVRGAGARRAAGIGEVDVQVDPAGQIGFGAGIEDGSGELCRELGVDGAVGGRAGVPGGGGAGGAGEGDAGDSCERDQ